VCKTALLRLLLKIDDFVEFQSIFLMRMNRQIDAAEWPSFDQKRLSRFGPGTSFSMVTPWSLPQPKSAASLRPLLRIDDLVGIQKRFFENEPSVADDREWIMSRLKTDHQRVKAKRGKGGTSSYIKQFNKKHLSRSRNH
jgi:hypothetical protein